MTGVRSADNQPVLEVCLRVTHVLAGAPPLQPALNRRDRTLGFIIFLLFLLTPVIEIAVLIEVGSVIGTIQTILLIVATAVFGTVLLRRQGLEVLRRTQASLNQGEMPVAEVFEGVCLLAAGALLLTPGFITDFVGFLLLVPGLRILLGRALLQRFLARSQFTMSSSPGTGPHDDVLEGDFTEVPDEKPEP